MNFIKGPVCRGQVALDVIEDRFWVFFIDPKPGDDEWSAELLARQADNLRLPAADGSDARLLLGSWRKLAERENRVLAAKTAQLNQRFGGARKVDLSLIWDGDGRNPNAALTVFRHFDSASVVKGLVGDAPKTAWVLGYPLFERIYYLLVAGYDPYGNLAPPARQPPVHGLHAHGGRVELPDVPAQGHTPADARLLVSRRERPGQVVRRRVQGQLRARDRHRLPQPGSAARVLWLAEPVGWRRC